MSSPTEHHNSSRRFAVEQSLAPHVEARWAEDLMLELRLLGLSGDQIGAALSEVDSHCADSGEPAADSFGDAREYARSLGLQPRVDVSGRALLRAVGPVVLEILGMMLLMWGFTAWRRGEQLEITGGGLVGLVVVLLAVAALVRWSDAVLRLAVHRPVRLWCVVMTVAVVGTVPLVFVTVVLARLTAGWGVGLGTAALIGAVGWAAARHRAKGSLADPITSPFGATRPSGQSATISGPATSTGSARLTALAAHPEALIPIWTLIMLAVTWWLTR
jgi:hypothetical protein